MEENNTFEEQPQPVEMEKNFFIRCPTCRWARTSTGTKDDLEDIYEIKDNSCKDCGKWRRFKCPKCGRPATMKRIKGNAPPKKKEG